MKDEPEMEDCKEFMYDGISLVFYQTSSNSRDHAYYNQLFYRKLAILVFPPLKGYPL